MAGAEAVPTPSMHMLVANPAFSFELCSSVPQHLEHLIDMSIEQHNEHTALLSCFRCPPTTFSRYRLHLSDQQT
jgi:hypothetical protein